MMGVSLEQWRGSVGRFNALKIRQHSTGSRCKFSPLMHNFNHFKDHLVFIFSLIHSMILLFGFCAMVISLTVLAALIQLGSTPFTPPFFSCGKVSITLYLIFSVPKFLSYVLRICVAKICTMGTNIAFTLSVLSLLLIMAGIETNPGPSSKRNLSFAVWNLDSLPARDYARVPLIESFQAEYKFDIFGVCESALNASIPNDSILVDGFSPDPIRADKADDTRNGGVCLYHRADLPIKSRTDLATLPETIVAEIKLNRKKIFFVLSYRHPNIPIAEFKNYVSSLEDILEKINKENPSAIILSGDFNARSPLFWEGDSETKEGQLFSEFLISHHMDELINEPNHIRDDALNPA